VLEGIHFNPQAIELELKSGLMSNEMRGQMKREAKGDEGGDEREPCRELVAIGQKRDENGAGERDEKDESEYRAIH